MLTWPWVTIEWNTPPIHTVEVRADSSGVSEPPERSRWPCGRSTASSLGLSTTCVRPPVKNESSRPFSRSAWRVSGPKKASSRSSVSNSGADENRLGAGVLASGFPGHARQAASGRASAASIKSASSAEVAVGLSASNQPKNPRCDFAPGSSKTGSSWMATSECSCCKRFPGKPVARATGCSPARVARPWNWSASVE